jgi:hypothetical protein
MPSRFPFRAPLRFPFHALLSASLLLGGGAITARYAHADPSTAASALSAMPLASVALGASAAVAGAVILPAAVLSAGSVLLVKTVEVSAQGTVYVLERASDGARVSVELLAGGAMAASMVTGAVVAVSVIGAGTILSAAGEVIAFIPNALGKALLHNERVSR